MKVLDYEIGIGYPMTVLVLVLAESLETFFLYTEVSFYQTVLIKLLSRYRIVSVSKQWAHWEVLSSDLKTK